MQARLLARKGQRVPLGSKAFEVLTCLVAHAGEVVTKDLLLKTVWPNSFVEENNLTQHIFSLRKALGERADYVVTVPGRGYQFTGQVLEIVPAIPKPYAPMVEESAAPAVPEPQVPLLAEAPPMVAELVTPQPEQHGSVPQRPLPRTDGRALWAGVGALAVVGLLAIWSGWRHIRFVSAMDEHTVVLAEFSNTTGDATFDGTLQRALKIQLGQAPTINVMGEREEMTTLEGMGRAANDAMTPDVAREVCERSKRQVVLMGCIAPMGREYLLTLEAKDCKSGRELVGAKAQVATKEQVLGALDAMAERVRRGLDGPSQ